MWLNKNINVIETTVRNFPGKKTRLEFSSQGSWSQIELTKFVVNSFFSFINGFVEILSADLSVTYYDMDSTMPEDDIRPSQQFWQLRKRQIDTQVSFPQSWENEKMVDVDEINSFSVYEWIVNALAANESVDPEIGLTWRQIIIPTTSCNSGLSAAGYSKTTISVRERVRTYEHPTETKDGNIWFTGPLQRKSLDAPIEFRLDNYSGLVTLDISLYWSIWAEEGTPGAQKVQESINKLLQDGWVYPSD